MSDKPKRRQCKDPSEFDEYFDRWIHTGTNLKEFYRIYLNDYNLYPMGREVFYKRHKTIEEINKINNNPKNLKELVYEYYDSKSTKRRMDIRYGEGSGEKHSNNLKLLCVDKITPHVTQYWINKGFSEAESIQKVYDYKNKNVVKAIEANKNLFLNNPKKFRTRYVNRKAPNSRKHWEDLGYSKEDVEEIMKTITRPYLNSLEGFVERYGEVLGVEKYRQANLKRLESRMKNNGTLFISSHVSKASLKYFIPLYKLLRKSGISKDDIVWGIAKKKEFVTKDSVSGKNFAYDFVIKSKRIIIEYNDSFWHARRKDEWKNNFTTYEKSLEFDQYKQKVAENIGFKIIYVWADELPTHKELFNRIRNE
jgi:hypothetical protein